MTRHWISKSMSLFVCLFLHGTTSQAQNVSLSEHFKDPDKVAEDWREVDNTKDQPWGPGIFTLVDEAYHFESTREVPPGAGGLTSSLFADWGPAAGYENAVLRVTGRAGEAGNQLMHGLRANGLWAYAFGTNEPGEFQLSSFRGHVPDVVHVSFIDEQTRFRPNEDWIIRRSHN